MLTEALDQYASRRTRKDILKEVSALVTHHGPGMTELVELVSQFADLMSDNLGQSEALEQV